MRFRTLELLPRRDHAATLLSDRGPWHPTRAQAVTHARWLSEAGRVVFIEDDERNLTTQAGEALRVLPQGMKLARNRKAIRRP